MGKEELSAGGKSLEKAEEDAAKQPKAEVDEPEPESEQSGKEVKSAEEDGASQEKSREKEESEDKDDHPTDPSEPTDEKPAASGDVKTENGPVVKNEADRASTQGDEGKKADGKKENALDHVDIPRNSKNRVKLYVLCEQRVWDDRGTGHVACIPAGNDSSAYVIIVKLESTEKNVLESKVLMETVYQKQQETLIVWSESDTCDLALSFQEKSGCEEIWAKICEVQGKDPGDADAGYDDMDEADLSEGSTSGSRVILPPVEMGRLGEIELAISNHIASAMLREKMANAIENENVIAKLIDLFHMCEDLDHSEGLRYLYSITKNMFMLNRNSINDTLLDDRYLKDVIGMLEYDPAHEEPRKHREFLFEKAKFREVLPIASDELKEKIHKTYRVQYLQDVCLPAPSLFEENLLSVLNSYIFFSRIDIVTMLQKDRQLMKELFEQLKDPETGVAQRRDLAFFLKEFITLSSSLPSNGPQSKDNFYKALSNNDILGVIEPCIISPDVDTRVTIVEMLALLVEHNPQQVRDYLLRQAKDKQQEQILLNRLISHMQTDRDPELTSANQVAQVLRTLLDPDTMVSMQKADRSEFLQLFYTRSIGTLVKPLADNVQSGVLKKDDYVTANRQALVVRLLCFCIEHHSHSMRSYAINNDLLNKVLVLLKSKHHFLSLSALKILRTVIGVKNDYHFYFRHIVKERVLDKVVECFKANGNRYNLLNSAILELFDFIRSENIKTLVSYTIENHQSAFENITYVKLFTDLKIRYEQNQEREQSQSNLASTKEDDRVASPVFVKERQEEQWFEEDDEEESSQAGGAKEKVKREDVLPRKSGIETMFPSLTKRKSMMEDEDDDIAGVLLGATSAAASNHANSPPGTNNPPVTLIGPGAQQDKKLSFVIKLGGDRSRTPSPSGPSTSPQSAQATSPSNQNADSRDDEVTSSQNHKHNEQPPSPVSSVRSLVDYDESDSDEEESNNSGSSEKEKPPANGNKESGTSHHPDSIPTSSTGSPVFGDEKDQAGSGLPSSAKESSPDDDVSSTSGDNDDKPDDVGLAENKETATANGHPEHSKKLEQDPAYPVTPRSGKRPSSESLTDEQADAKRSKIDQTGTGPESETAEHAEQHLEANSDQTQGTKA